LPEERNREIEVLNQKFSIDQKDKDRAVSGSHAPQMTGLQELFSSPLSNHVLHSEVHAPD
jgi:hypothetical protein